MVAQFGDKTYLATVTVQTTAADNPTYVRDCHDNFQGIPGAAARRGQPLLSRCMPARWRRDAVGDVLTAQLGFDEFLGERVLVTVDLNTAAATRPGRAAHAMPRCSARRSTRTARRSMGLRGCGSPTAAPNGGQSNASRPVWVGPPREMCRRRKAMMSCCALGGRQSLLARGASGGVRLQITA